jgi:hypothetical protein
MQLAAVGKLFLFDFDTKPLREFTFFFYVIEFRKDSMPPLKRKIYLCGFSLTVMVK